MKLEQMNITLPSSVGNTVIMKKYMTMKEVEEYRRDVQQIFEVNGFAGAMVSFMYGEDASDHTAPEPEMKQEPVDDVDPDTLPQYRRFSSIRNLFKK